MAATHGRGCYMNNLTSVLPVQLASFVGRLLPSGVVHLEWRTATELNNYGFEVERTQDAPGSTDTDRKSWARVGFVGGAGASNSPRDYAFDDQNAPTGMWSYRLKQIDRDGRVEYSSAVDVEIAVPKLLTLSQNYPDPFNPTTRMDFTIPEDGFVSLKVFGVLGREVATLVSEDRKAGSLYHATFDGSSLPSGVYFSRLEHGNRTLIRKLLLLK